MVRIEAMHPSWEGLQFTINGTVKTVGKGIEFDSIPKEILAKVETYERLKVIKVIRPKAKETFHKETVANVQSNPAEDDIKKKGGK